MTKGILVAGMGNIFFGDDAFGIEVTRQLMRCELPEGVTIVEFGIRSYDLAYALTEGYEVTILVDATTRGNEPGTLYLIEPDSGELGRIEAGAVDAHAMNPTRLLQLAQALGGPLGRLYLVGCEPAVLENEDGDMGLSAEVQAAVPHALEMIQSLINDLIHEPIENKQPGLAPA